MWDGYCSKCYKEVKNHSPLTRRQFDSYSDSIAPQGSPQLSTAMALGSVAPESPVSAPFSTSGGQSLEPKGAGSPLSNSIEQSPAASPTLRAKLASSVSKVSPNTQAKSSLRESKYFLYRYSNDAFDCEEASLDEELGVVHGTELCCNTGAVVASPHSGLWSSSLLSR